MARREYGNPEMVETRLMIEHPYKRGVFLPIRRRPMRLVGCDYTSPECLCFVTFNVHSKCGVRFEHSRAELAWEWIWKQLELAGCQVHAVCLMSDHVHLLLAPSGNGESVSDIVQRMKTMVCTALRKDQGIYLKWQTSFYDHVLNDKARLADEYATIMHYIYDNPNKAGLGDDYPYKYRTT